MVSCSISLDVPVIRLCLAECCLGVLAFVGQGDCQPLQSHQVLSGAEIQVSPVLPYPWAHSKVLCVGKSFLG